MVQVINGDCLEVLRDMPPVDCIFADPPDNLGLNYDAPFTDALEANEYALTMRRWLCMFVRRAPVVWVSFNSRHILTVGEIASQMFGFDCVCSQGWTFVPAVQTFGFGCHNPHGLTNNHRPLWLFHQGQLDPSAAKVPSVRGKMGDKRAPKDGLKTPGDVFDYCRVQGNNKQRRPWHPT